MREFFKEQLKALYRLTGLLQYQKMSDLVDKELQIKLLLDELEQVCTWFPLIPIVDKKRIILDYMLRDPEFMGFNKKIILKWLNFENHKYFPDQTHYVEVNTTPAPPDIADKYLEDWKIELAKIDYSIPREDGIKDQRIQQMKDGFAIIKCKHPIWIYFSDTEERCNDCGISRVVSEQKAPNQIN